MRSRAHIKSHPLHPILIAFPIAFFIGAFIFDLISLTTGTHSFWQTGYYLAVAGIIGAVAAAIPGAIDYFYTVPPRSSAKKRATSHAILNLLNLGLFIISVYYRQREANNPYNVLAAEGIGIILLSIAGWMGGTLVHRNQISVDHRYAGAGKWNEAFLRGDGNRIEVARVDELQNNAMKLVHINGRRIVIGRTEKGFVAFSDRCPHKGGSLADGVLICNTVHCPWHGSHFDVYTGEIKAGPAREKIECYPLEETEGRIYLLL